VLGQTGAQTVKVEAGQVLPESIAFLTGRGIPVIGHVGLRPQAVTFRDKWRGFCSAIWRASARWPASESAVDGRP